MKATLAFALPLALAAVFAIGKQCASEKSTRQTHHFSALGDLPGGAFFSTAYGISADGSVVVGYSSSGTGVKAFRWTEGGGMAGLGFTQAFATNDDGSTVVGFRHIAGRAEPVRWTSRGGTKGLGNIAGFDYGEACGASADGSIIVGTCEPSSAPRQVPFRYTAEGCIGRLEQLPSTVVEAGARAVSSDGKVVVGSLQYKLGRGEAFRWTASSRFVALGVLAGDEDSIAYATSADGSVVVGSSERGVDAQAFRWTQQAGMVGLGTLPGGGANSKAFGVSADGSVIVGQSDGASGPEAFIWDAVHGMRSVHQLLATENDFDAPLRRWKLRSAMAVSRDGSAVVGFGTNPNGDREAWIARLANLPATDAPTFTIAKR